MSSRMLIVAAAACLATVLTAMPAQAADATLYFHGDTQAFDNQAPSGKGLLWADPVAPTGSQPRIIISHDPGATTPLANPITFAMKDPFAEATHIGDGKISTKGVDTDFVAVNACLSETTQSAFVPRVLVTLLLDDVTIGTRLFNGLSLPANAPKCTTIPVALNQAIDDQTPANDNPDLGIALDSNGDLLAPAGSKLAVKVQVDTAIGGPAWLFYYDSPSYPSAAAFSFTAGASAVVSPAASYATLSGPTARVNQTFTAVFSGVKNYNWTTTLTSAVLSAKVVRQNGTVDIKVLDASNKTVVSKTISATGTTNVSIDGAKAGKWRMVLTYSGFRGNLSLTMGAPTGSGPSGTSQAPGSTSSEPSGSASGSPNPSASASASSSAPGSSSSSKGSPPVEVGVLVAALGAILVMRRRTA